MDGASQEPVAVVRHPEKSPLTDPVAVEAIGEMAGQIAHDFNNLLTPLLAYPALIRTELPEGGVGRSLVDVLEKATRDMVHLTRQLLALSGRGMAERQTFSLNGLVSDSLLLVGEMAKARDVQVRSELGSGLPDLLGSPQQILAAMQNLVENAVEAAPQGGKVAVRTDACELTASMPAFGSEIGRGSYQRVAVQDDGGGIPEELAARIFDPFVTSKRNYDRRGAGLGLTIVYRILRAHGGHVRFESSPDKGTTFWLYFPQNGAL